MHSGGTGVGVPCSQCSSGAVRWKYPPHVIPVNNTDRAPYHPTSSATAFLGSSDLLCSEVSSWLHRTMEKPSSSSSWRLTPVKAGVLGCARPKNGGWTATPCVKWVLAAPRGRLPRAQTWRPSNQEGDSSW